MSAVDVILVKLISIIIPVVLGLNEISVKLGSIIIPVVLLFIEIVVLADSNETLLLAGFNEIPVPVVLV